MTPVKLAVVTGGHPFDAPAFRDLFAAMPGVDFYIQSLDDFTFAPETAAFYDVALFYQMHRFHPGDDLPWHQKNVFSTLETRLGRNGQGIVVLHHGLLAFPAWPLWSELVGVGDRGFGYHFGEPVNNLCHGPHPILEGSPPVFTLPDETYTMADAGPDSRVLLTTDHPRSMKTLAWTRAFRGSRVFCYQAGHDAGAFGHPDFRRVLHRGILWAGSRL